MASTSTGTFYRADVRKVGKRLPRARVSSVCRAVAPVQLPTLGHDKTIVSKSYEGKRLTQDELDRAVSSYVSQPVERVYKVTRDQITGRLPADLQGTLLRNGPGNYDIGGHRIQHPFDGDGVISSFTFSGGEVLYRRKFVRTSALVDEMAAGRLLSKGVFAASDDGKWQLPFDISVRKPANTGVVDWAGRVLALFEADLPYELDGALRTVGTTTLGAWKGGDVMAAHYRVVTEPDGSGRLVTFGATTAGLDASVRILELDEEGNKVEDTAFKIRDAAFGFFHDILVTANYYVLIENPTRLDFWKLLTEYVPGKACIAECLQFDGRRPMKIHCIPRPGKAGVARPVYTAPSAFAFHHINAFEADSATIVIDTLARPRIAFDLRSFAKPTAEYLSDPQNATTLRRLIVRGTASRARAFDIGRTAIGRSHEFPAMTPPGVVGRRHSTYYATASRDAPGEVASAMFQCIAKVRINPSALLNGQSLRPGDVSTSYYYPGDYRYCGEPVFVPRAGAAPGSEDDGYILTIVKDFRTSGPAGGTALEILDAGDVPAGPVATIDLNEAMPAGLHGSWTSRVLGVLPDEPIPYVHDIRDSLSQS